MSPGSRPASGYGGRLLALIAMPMLLFGASGCGSATTSNDRRIVAVAGENFYGDVVTAVGGARVDVTSIISDPAADPHTYESSSRNAEAVADATLVVENGLGYDAFLDHLMAASPRSDRKVVNVQALLGLAEGSNAHVWYDPATMPRVARAVADALAQIEPAGRAGFEANLVTYLASFDPLTARIADIKARYPATKVAYTEPVPGYLLAALGFQSLTPPGFAKAIENGTDPAPADVAAERDLLTGHKVRLLLYNSQAMSPVTESIKSLAGDSGVPVVGVSETIPSRNESFVDWQLSQLNEMAAALGAAR
ncbi:MAG: metal ABC transporter solute-binding protein, Zn/Mn family [Candidatus Limnocylindrales bacterium]